MNVARLMRGAVTFVLRFVRTSFRGLGLDQRLRLIDLDARNEPVCPPTVNRVHAGIVRYEGFPFRQHLPRFGRAPEPPIRHRQYSASLGAGVNCRTSKRLLSPGYGFGVVSQAIARRGFARLKIEQSVFLVAAQG